MRRFFSFLVVLPLAICLASSTAWAGTLLYAMDDATNSLYTIDPTTFTLTLVGYTGVSTGDFGDMAWDTTNNTAYWSAGRGNGNIYTINLSTGAATLFASPGITDLFGLGYDPMTNLLYGEDSSSNFYSINPTTGAATKLGNNGVYPGGLTYNSTTGQLILTMAGGSGSFYSINPANGAATLLGSPGYLNDNGVTWDAALGVYFVDDWNGKLYEVNPNTWTYTVVSNLNGDPFDGIIYPVGGGGTTPEPSSLLLLGTGVVGLVGWLRRKR